MKEKSCGTILYTYIDGVRHYVLLRARDGYCGFPKGHVEGDESEAETALRETWEETSIRAAIKDGFREEDSYVMPSGNDKTVVYFVASYEGQTPRHNPGYEHREQLVLPYREACEALTYPASKALLSKAEAFLTGEEG